MTALYEGMLEIMVVCFWVHTGTYVVLASLGRGLCGGSASLGGTSYMQSMLAPNLCQTSTEVLLTRNNDAIPESTSRLERHKASVSGFSACASHPSRHLHSNLRIPDVGRCKHSILRDSRGFECRALARRVDLGGELSGAVTATVEVGGGHREAVAVERNRGRGINGGESRVTARLGVARLLNL